MIEIEFASNFDEIEAITEKLLTEYDSENNFNYNFKRFAFIAKENGKYVEYIDGFSYYAEVTIDNLVVRKEYCGREIEKNL